MILFADGNAKILAIQLYVAGTETTSNALNWAILFSCYHPDVMRRVQEEIDTHIGESYISTICHTQPCCHVHNQWRHDITVL